MRVSRNELAAHLRRVSVGGELTEVVVRPDLSVTAIKPDHSLMVDVPALPEAELPDPVGVSALRELIQAVELGTDPQTTINVLDGRLVLDEGELGTVSFLTTPPDRIHTTVEAQARERLLADLEGPSARLGRQLVDRISKVQDLLGAREIRLDCGPEGTTWVIGGDSGHHATYLQGELTTQGEEYSLILQAHMVVRLFRLLPEEKEAHIVLTGPDSIVKIEFEDHTYMMNPMNP